MCLRLFVLAGILPGCWKETHFPSCSEPEYTDLADDEASPLGWTANDLLSIATPGWAGAGLDVDNAEVDIAWTLVRGEGSARFADTEEIDVVTRQFGFGDDYLLLAVQCNDWLEVPADFTIASEGAGIEAEMDAALRSPVSYSVSPEVGADILASEPYADSGVIVPGADDSFEVQTLEAWISAEPDGTSDGSLSWNGMSDTRAQTIYALSWDDIPNTD
jgi:hypothetical protein